MFYAGWLGHYVADGSNPLHTTIQYNGWTGANPNGYTTSDKIHWQFEGLFVKENLAKLDFAPMVKTPTSPLADEWKDYLAYLRQSNGLVEKLYQIEKTGAFTATVSDDPESFDSEKLKDVDAIVMMSNTGELFVDKAADGELLRDATAPLPPGLARAKQLRESLIRFVK